MTSGVNNSQKDTNNVLQSRIDDLETQLSDFKNTKKALSERIKELECLNNLFRLASNKNQSTDHFLQAVANLLPSGFQAPECTCCRITYEGHTFISDPFCESSSRLSAAISINEQPSGLIEVLIKEKDFIKEEQNLVNLAANTVSEWLTHVIQVQAIHEARESLQAILDHSPLIITEIDSQGFYLRLNHAASELFLEPPEKLIGKNFRDLVSEEISRSFMSRINQVLEACQPIVVEDRLQVADQTHTYLSTLFPLFTQSGEIRSIVSIALDITDRKQVEMELEALKEHLEIQVAEKTAQLQERVQQLEQFHEATIEREFRMEELRQELAELKENQGNNIT